MKLLILCTALVTCAPLLRAETIPWESRVNQEANRLGHRNMIVVADSAYPVQTGKGVKVVSTGADHLTVVKAVLAAIRSAPGVRPLVALDKEFAHLPEEHAKGAAALRKSMLEILPRENLREELHETLLKEVNTTAESYEVIVFKTTGTTAYSSVFFTLDCGYWSAEAEQALRKRMEKDH